MPANSPIRSPSFDRPVHPDTMQFLMNRLENRTRDAHFVQSANPRQLIARQQIDNPRRSKCRPHGHQSCTLLTNRPDIGLPAARIAAHRGQNRVGRSGRHNRHQFPFIRHIQRVSPSNSHAPFTSSAPELLFPRFEYSPRLLGNFIQCAG